MKMILIISFVFLTLLLSSCALGSSMLVRVEDGPAELPPRSILINKYSYITYLKSKLRDEKKALYIDLKLRIASDYMAKKGANTVRDLPLSSSQYYYFELDLGDGNIYKPLGDLANVSEIKGPDFAYIRMSFKLPKDTKINSVKLRYIADSTYRKKYPNDLVWFDISEFVKQEDSKTADIGQSVLKRKKSDTTNSKEEEKLK